MKQYGNGQHQIRQRDPAVPSHEGRHERENHKIGTRRGSKHSELKSRIDKEICRTPERFDPRYVVRYPVGYVRQKRLKSCLCRGAEQRRCGGNANNRGGKQFGIPDQEKTGGKCREANQAGGDRAQNRPRCYHLVIRPHSQCRINGQQPRGQRLYVRSGPIIVGIFRSENNPIKNVVVVAQLIQAIDKLLVQFGQPRRGFCA